MRKAADWAAGLAVLTLGAPAAATAEAPIPLSAGQATAEGPGSDYRKGIEAANAGRLDEAEATARRLLDASPQSTSGRKLMGLVKARRGDLAGAVAEFDRVLAADPKSVGARAERAVAAARLGHLEKAKADLESLRDRAQTCGKTCPPELKVAISRVEAALAAARPPTPAAPATPASGIEAPRVDG